MRRKCAVRCERQCCGAIVLRSRFSRSTPRPYDRRPALFIIAAMSLAHAIMLRTSALYFVALIVWIAACANSANCVIADEPAEQVRSVPEIAASRGGLYLSNREPLLPAALLKLPIGSIVPQGWVREQLNMEAAGLTGRLMEISPWCRFENNAWTDPEGKGHSGWEEMPYWLKGYGDLGYVLKDEAIIKIARRWIEAALASQSSDGWFGPRSLRTALDGKPDLWPHMLMLNALQSYFEYTGDRACRRSWIVFFDGSSTVRRRIFSPDIGRLRAAATIWKACIGFTIARARSGSCNWPRKSIATRAIGRAAWPIGMA